MSPFRAWREWLGWLDSEEGLTWRKGRGGAGDEYDIACTLPTPPGSSIVTVGDVRRLVEEEIIETSNSPIERGRR